MSASETPTPAELISAIWPEGGPAPMRLVGCRHCELKNRAPVPAAVAEPSRLECGGCGKSLFLDPDEPLRGLASSAYQHSLDRRSLEALRSIPGVPSLVRWTLRHISDRSARVLFMSDAILCGDEQFPELVALVERARVRLDLPLRPSVFLGESPHMNALTTGVDEPIIVVRSSLLDQMSDPELVAVLGHELGHLHADHPLYHAMASALLQGGAVAWPTLRMLTLPLHRAILRWVRCAELTADRAALLASRDLGACIGMLLTFAGGSRPGITGRTRMQLAPFIRQCRELARLQTGYTLDTLIGGVLAMDRTHPHVAWRVMHLIHWVEHGNYLDILSGSYRRRRVSRSSGQPGAGPHRKRSRRADVTSADHGVEPGADA